MNATLLTLEVAEHQTARVELPKPDANVRYSASALRLRLLWPCLIWVGVVFGCLAALISAHLNGVNAEVAPDRYGPFFAALPYAALIALLLEFFLMRRTLLKVFAQKFLLSKTLEEYIATQGKPPDHTR